MQPARIEVNRLGKTYGPVTALADVTLTAKPATILGILGHNGAGKTTLIDILATRTRPSAGTAAVCGWDVVRFGHHVRRHIGMTGQFASLDEGMSGRGNLVLLARLLGARRKQAKARAEELIEAFTLTEAAERKVSTYSGGMRRRIDLAASLLGSPDVLFLDEPTTGLDPVSRTELWQKVADLARDGTTVLLTTQYLEEADRLADDVVVLAAGSVIARGTPAELKAGIGQRTATVHLADPRTADQAVSMLAASGISATRNDIRGAIVVPIADAGDIAGVVRALDIAGLRLSDLTVSEPTLDDVYLKLHSAGRDTPS